MWYAIMSEDAPNTLAARIAARPAHLARLQALHAEGRILIAGPHPAIDSIEPGDAGYSGSLVVAEFDSLASAEAFANSDPYIAAGVYERVVVKPYRLTLP